jgi:hypothetical protein
MGRRRAGRACRLILQFALLTAVVLPVPLPASAQTSSLEPRSGTRPDAEMSMTMPPDCSGYRERRRFLEVQAWWKGTNTPNGRAHLHAGTCFPLGKSVHGKIRFDVRIIMHNNPGHLFSLSVGVLGGKDRYINLDKRCPDTCTFWVTAWVDTRTTLDGWHEFRFKPRVRFRNGKRMMTSTGWPANINNGRRIGDENRDSIGDLVARGWYEGHGYQNPVLRNAREAMRGPLSGIWRPEVRLREGAQGYRPTLVGAYVDPDFHNNDSGIVILQRAGPYEGPLSIDTRELKNGWHRLALRVTAYHNGGLNSGLEVIWFYVQN